mgnify:CR=1 FL=1
MARRKFTDVERKLMKDIASNIRQHLSRCKMSQKELAEKTGLSTSVISDYLNEKTLPTPGSVQAIADALGIKKSDIDPTFNDLIEISELIQLPIVGRISCGNGSIAFEDIEGYEAVPRDWVSSGEHFFLRASGDSMIGARILDGDLVLIRKQDDVENGEIAAVLINNEEAVLKRVYKHDDMIVLQSENPNYPPIFCPPAEVRIIGKLIMNVIKFN